MATNSSMVKYGAFELDAAEEEERLTDEVEEASEYLKLGQGKNVVRFLPPPQGAKSPFRVCYEHFVDLPDGKSKLRFNCPRLMQQRRCPACAKADDLRRTGNPVDRNAAFKLKAKRRVYANVIDRGHEEHGPRVLAFGKSIHDALIAIRKDTADGGDFTDPTAEGFDVIITKTGEMLETEYTVRPARNQTPLHEDAATLASWIADQYDLEAYAFTPSESELARMMSGQSGQRRDDAGGERRGSMRDAKPRRRTAADDMDDSGSADVVD